MKGDLEALEIGRMFHTFLSYLLVLALHYMHGHHGSVTENDSLSCHVSVCNSHISPET